MTDHPAKVGVDGLALSRRGNAASSVRQFRISDVDFHRADDAHRRTGVEGWVRLVLDGWLRLDSLVIRRRADGTLGVFYPERRNEAQRRFALIWPVSEADRAAFEALVIREITARGGLS